MCMQVALTPQATTPDREIGPYRRKDYEMPSGAWYQSPVLAEVRLDVAELWRRAARRAARLAPEK
jgi:hypothetical protein